MSKRWLAELEGGRRFGECLSKKTLCSRNRVLLAISSGFNAISSGFNAISSGFNAISSGFNAISSGFNAIGSGFNAIRYRCSTLSVSRFHRFYHPSVTTGIGARDLWKVNKNHRMRMVECR